jgi:photosystem II stability/assembly factor-like uncharacterized protein
MAWAMRRAWIHSTLPMVTLFMAAVSSAASNSVRPAVLDLPAAMSARCLQGVLLGIQKAGRRLVAVGERGCIVYTDDDGHNWRQARVPVSVTLTAVAFPSPLQGWAAGHFGVVLHTKDGGATWATQLDGVRAARLRLDQVSSGPVGASGSLVEISNLQGPQNAALEAAKQLVDDGPDKPFLSIHFESDRKGLVVGAYGLAYKTADGGLTWQPWQDHLDNPDGQHLYAIASYGDRLLLAGEQGYFARSSDGGKRFARQQTSYAGTLFGLESRDGLRLVAYGLRGNAVFSSDAGGTWESVKTGVVGAIDGSCVLDNGQYVFVTDRGEVLVSEDQGRTVRVVPIEHPFPFSGIIQASDGTLVAVGARGASRLTLRGPLSTR